MHSFASWQSSINSWVYECGWNWFLFRYGLLPWSNTTFNLFWKYALHHSIQLDSSPFPFSLPFPLGMPCTDDKIHHIHTLTYMRYSSNFSTLKKWRRCLGSNPGRPRDRRKDLPLYYNDLLSLTNNLRWLCVFGLDNKCLHRSQFIYLL